MTENDVLVNEYKKLFESYKKLYETLLSENNDLKLQLQIEKEKYETLRRRLFGVSSEKSSNLFGDFEQLNVFNEAEELSTIKENETPLEDETIVVERRKHNKGRYLDKLDNLPHEKILYTLPDNQKVCECGSEMKSIGEKFIRSELEIIPASIKVIDIYEESVECRSCRYKKAKSIIKTPAVPIPIIPHSYATPSSVASLMIEKYQKAVPLYRQEESFKAMGFELSRTTMANWIIYTSLNYLKPIVNRMHEILVEENYVHCDESSIQVLKEPGKNPQSKSYVWVYSSIKESKYPIRIFDYQPSRKGINPLIFLDGFKGVTISDGYSAYKNLPGVKNAFCHAHARRKYVDALPKDVKDKKDSLAGIALSYFSKLFKIEDEIFNLDNEEKLKTRQEKSKPILDEYFVWCKENIDKVGVGTNIYKAINYSLNQEEGLKAFLDDPLIPMTNSLDERVIRPFATGRNNWLFSTSVDGATSSAIVYSIISTSKANNLDPYKYLIFIFKELPSLLVRNELSNEILDKFLPWNEIPQNICKSEISLESKEQKPSDYVNHL